MPRAALCACMAGVQMGLIRYLQLRRSQRRQAFPDEGGTVL